MLWMGRVLLCATNIICRVLFLGGAIVGRLRAVCVSRPKYAITSTVHRHSGTHAQLVFMGGQKGGIIMTPGRSLHSTLSPHPHLTHTDQVSLPSSWKEQWTISSTALTWGSHLHKWGINSTSKLCIYKRWGVKFGKHIGIRQTFVGKKSKNPRQVV